MTDNSSQELADLLTDAVSESLLDVLTVAQTVTGQTGEVQDGASEMSEISVADYIHYVMSAIIGPIVCFFGMGGNLVSVITWNRPGMSGSTGRYLTGQAIANFLVLLMFLLVDSIHCWFPDVKFSTAYGEFFCYFGFPFFYFTAICSIWFTVGVTVDRYIMVCWITKAKNLCSESRATFSLVLISVNGFLINIPHFTFFTPVYPDVINDDNNNNTEVKIATMAFTASTFQVSPGGQFFEFWIHCIVLILGPWLAVCFMNVMIIVKSFTFEDHVIVASSPLLHYVLQLSLANKNMADKKSSQAIKKSKESENQVTRLLLTVTFTFLFFIGLMCIVQCLWMSKPPGANMAMLSTSVAFGKTAILFNSSLNFILYCLTGRRFRLELLKMLGLGKKETSMSSSKDTSNNISTTSTATSTITTSVATNGI